MHSVFDRDCSGTGSLSGFASQKLPQLVMEKSFLKIAVELHEHLQYKKVRFDVNAVKSYTRIQLVKEIGALFPHIAKKGCTLQLHHYDDLAAILNT